ncbi:MAG: type VII secretion protein EssC [Bacilli bacterium]|nr:type VII secretion protein EssC [Bacilli bacterium]
MIVRLIKKKKIYNFTLPIKISGNYWITDNDYLGNARNLINVEEEDGKWKIKSDFETKIMSGEQEIESAYLKDYSLFFLKINTDNEYVILYCSPTLDKESFRLKLKGNNELLIGNHTKANISYNFPLVSKDHAKLFYNEGKWVIQDLGSKYGTYVNNTAVTTKKLEYGDIIFIMGLKIIVMKDTLIVNNIGQSLSIDGNCLESVASINQKQVEFDNPDEEAIEFYKEDDYFYRAPRFKTGIQDALITIDPPPGGGDDGEEEKVPLIYTLGPMLTMGMTSMTTGITALQGVINGTADWSTAAPSLLMTGAMMATMLLFPQMQAKYQKKLAKKAAKERTVKYLKYLDSKKEEIQSEMKVQRQILIDNYLPLDQTKEIIYQKKRNLWERELTQNDFLDLRLGLGSSELRGQVNIPDQHFELKTDELLKEVYKLGAQSQTLENVPISLNFVNNNIVAIIGTAANKKQFIEGLLLQIITFHSYEDLKIVLFTNEQNESNWEFLKITPHCWNNNKTFRYFSTNLDEAKAISLELEKEMQQRKMKDVNGKMEDATDDYHSYKPYYLIITDDYKSVRDIELLKDVGGMSVNFGFSLIVISPRLINIPNECNAFVSIGDKKSGVFENELIANKQKEFVADFDPTLNIFECSKIIANIPIDIAKEEQALPTSVSFLEMYNVGMVEQLNILNRWKVNDPTKSLQTPVGLDKSGELFKLDLHEKAHGPHGLIAGMTGSGKSEFIITYILSMAMNYHPYEVTFILIDYKGGGLTGAFENRETGMKLPHLAGTITNLDTVEMNRSLASIQSELRKRQRQFNEARDKLNESTIDIYKYQSLYRKGVVDKPISHLFIISDEFAELKDQRPEFMEQLISTARIGRSLGVHLILATQKPSGVVNDQIWSNSKFRVCLRVQDKSDSMDMIKCPDAAELKNTGRFYLQVGYNELFAMGQAAWAGAQYYPTEKRKKKVDQSITIVDNVGSTIKSLDTKQNEVIVQSQGEEITNIIQYIIAESKKENIQVEQLWLPRIPDIIFTDDLKEKYHYQPVKNDINPIIGEYDDPDNQTQNVLTLPLSREGNTIIFGSAGNGKELMLAGIIYSSITLYNSNQVNFYILDFGAETLTMFKKAPHVGEVILAAEAEKIENLFKLVNQILEERKKIFTDYNGSFDFYLNHGGKQIPLIVVVINNVEAFFETYEQYEEIIGQMTRDCLKYGVVFIFSTNGPNTVRYKLRQNFRQNVVLQFNDPMDYSSVIPGVRKKEPSKVYGRGLISLDGIFEFQTAYAYKEEKMTDYIKVICEKLNKICTYNAQKIPILPETVTQEYVSDYLGKINSVPVGVEKDTLNIATIDLNNRFMFNITGEDVTSEPGFLRGFIKVLTKLNNTECIVFDPNDVLMDFSAEKVTVSKDDCTQSKDKLLAEYNNNDPNKTVYGIIINVQTLLNKMDAASKADFTTLIINSKDKGNIRYIIVDSIEVIKSISFENWYKGFSDMSEGVWIGNGISNQFTLKVTTNSRILRQEVEPGFGYNIKKGKAELTKFISEE